MVKIFLTICTLLAISGQAKAAELFGSHEILKIKLSGPLNSLIRNKEDELQYPFVLSVEGQEISVKLSARGNSRKKLCKFPPIRIEFDTNTSEQSIFNGQDNLKLVSHCHQSEKAQANTLKEYAAYQFFSLLSDASFRTRLLKISYQDTDGKRDTTRYGFVLENTDAIAKRIGGERVSLPAISLKSLNDRQEALVYVFQYLIGNTDWSMVTAENDQSCCHNGKLIKKDQQLLYVPYDFDLSGLVNAKYARPDASFSINRVTQRLYRGFCLKPEVLKEGLQTVVSHQDDFRAIISGLPGLSEKDIKKVQRFLDRFFSEASDEDKMLKSFEKRCHE